MLKGLWRLGCQVRNDGRAQCSIIEHARWTCSRSEQFSAGQGAVTRSSFGSRQVKTDKNKRITDARCRRTVAGKRHWRDGVRGALPAAKGLAPFGIPRRCEEVAISGLGQKRLPGNCAAASKKKPCPLVSKKTPGPKDSDRAPSRRDNRNSGYPILF
jgi:hypothetical protein